MAPIFSDTAPIKVSKSVVQPKAIATPTTVKKPESTQNQPKPQLKSKPQASRSKSLPPLGISVRLGANKSTDKSAEQVTEKTSIYGHAPLEQAHLESVWKKFADSQEVFLQQTLLHSIPRLKNDTTVVITLENIFQRDKINDIKSTMMPYLRTHLHNEDVELEIEIPENIENHKAYTPREKLEELMKDNPALVKLIKEFDLELE